MFKVGVFMGWADVTLDESIPWDMLIPLYIGATLWNVTYETIYQHQVSLKLPPLSHTLSPSTDHIA